MRAKEQATVAFRLRLTGDRLTGGRAIISSLPVIRTAERAKAEGVPIYAVVLNQQAQRLDNRSSVKVSASIAEKAVELADGGNGIWKAVLRDLPVGSHRVRLLADWPMVRMPIPVETTLDVHITDGRFIGYDEKLKLLTEGGKLIGPFAGSYRGAPMFKAIGTPQESLVEGQADWDAVKGNRHEGQHSNHGSASPAYGFHFWESLTERELDADYAYLAKCGWTVTHLCQGWWVWERLDAGGRLAPHGAEQLAALLVAAERHGLRLHLAASHYPLGKEGQPWAQYLEAGYRRDDYNRTDSKFYALFNAYLRDFASVFRDATALSSYTAAGEGDVDCGKTFVNSVCETMRALDPNHLFLCEPHLNPKPYPPDVNYYRRDGWKPLLGGMRTYAIDHSPFEHIAVQFKLAGLGHIFLGEGVFWGFNNGARATDRYRTRIRQEFYTGLAYRLPIQLTWEERVTEDERIVFDQVRRSVDWTKPFARPRLLLRFGGSPNVFIRYERALSRFPLEYAFIEKDDPAPPGAHIIDTTAPFDEGALAFASEGGKLPDALKADMPLRLPAGFVASYSWSEDRKTLLAYLQQAEGGEGSAAPGRDTTEAGDYTYVDTTRVIGKDALLDAWEIECVKPGRIQLAIWRKEGEELVRVGQGRMVEMAKPGPNRFALDTPIAAKKGDLIGFYIPDAGTHVAAESGGNMLNVKGPVAEARTPLARWETEAKRVEISAFNTAEVAAPRPGAPTRAPGAAAGIVLHNFPDARLSYRLCDLAEKKMVLEGGFQRAFTLAAPPGARHLFLLVRE